jgi:hypothetical protein
VGAFGHVPDSSIIFKRVSLSVVVKHSA